MADDTGDTGERIDQRALDEVVRFTSDLIRIDTTNRGGGDCRERPAAEYIAERLAEAGLEPLLLERDPGRTNLVARIPGRDRRAPALLMHGHLDVVPAEPADWSVHPFSGEVRDGMVWGRGAIDMKGTDAMMLAVVRAWARAGVRPPHDVVLAYTADEEDDAAPGAAHLATAHAELFQGCTEAIGESGAYTFHADGGLRLYPVAAGERGSGWVRLTAHGVAGHGSKVNKQNAVARLTAAVTRIAEHDWQPRLSPTVRASIREIAAAHGIEAEPDAPGFDMDCLLDKLGTAGKLLAAVVRNSANPTVLQAGYKVNVIPGTATALVDGRIVPEGDKEFLTTLDRLTGPDVDWEFVNHDDPLQVPVDSPLFGRMRAALEHFDPEARVVPFCMSGGTDAKYFSRLGIDCYGFSPVRLPTGFDYQALFHGVDERIPVDGLHFGVRVLDHFVMSGKEEQEE
ncbi:M20/M25/M40 family metallo-hydrolase [Streptomyces sp. NPDC052396]|uniref:M20/M25/M40 family metallo-hydrolase n=1 Tax=Streptomyces sp. NPDC052396 TaxID=3365689 RepID=UPI0037D77BEE